MENKKVILNSSQKLFCDEDAKYIRLLAPAGSGKTMTLLYRCKRLIEEHPNERILLFTFTRVARDELKIRLKHNPVFRLCASNITVSTLNSYGLRIVKNKSNLTSCFKLIEKTKRKWAVSNFLNPVIEKNPHLKEKMADKRWRSFNSEKLLDLIDIFKSLGFDHERLNSESDFKLYWKQLAESGLHLKLDSIATDLERLGVIHDSTQIYKKFFKFYVGAAEHLKSMNLYTLEDQKYWGWKYSEKGGKLTGAARYSHIMVDEFQDINPIDLLLIKSIRRQHDAALTVVGDDDQTIFEWRGATPQYILHPGKYFSGSSTPLDFVTCILDQNYRSPKNIVKMSTALIRNNQNRVEKNTVAVRQDSAEIKIKNIDDYDSAVQDILEAWNNPDNHQIAVISRKRSQLIPYQILFASREIPFFAAEDLNVFLTEAFNSVKGLLEIKQCYKDNAPRQFLYWQDAVINLSNNIRKYPFNREEREALRNYMCQAPIATMEDAVNHLYKYPKLERLFYKIKVCEIIRGFLKTESVAEMLEYVGDNFVGLQKDLRKADDDIFYADPPFAELADFSLRYGNEFDRFYFDVQKAIATLSAYLASSDQDDLSDEQEKNMSAKLHLMTALRTKGKEYDSVFILAANKGNWPTKFARTQEEFEAERRLFYVAITRTRKELNFMVYPEGTPTPYLQEMGLF